MWPKVCSTRLSVDAISVWSCVVMGGALWGKNSRGKKLAKKIMKKWKLPQILANSLATVVEILLDACSRERCMKCFQWWFCDGDMNFVIRTISTQHRQHHSRESWLLHIHSTERLTPAPGEIGPSHISPPLYQLWNIQVRLFVTTSKNVFLIYTYVEDSLAGTYKFHA